MSFKHYAEIDLKDDFETEKRFANIKTTKDFYLLVGSMFAGLNNIEDTIIFLDEIQHYPHLMKNYQRCFFSCTLVKKQGEAFQQLLLSMAMSQSIFLMAQL